MPASSTWRVLATGARYGRAVEDVLLETANGEWRIRRSKRPGFDLVHVDPATRGVTVVVEGAAFVELDPLLRERGVDMLADMRAPGRHGKD